MILVKLVSVRSVPSAEKFESISNNFKSRKIQITRDLTDNINNIYNIISWEEDHEFHCDCWWWDYFTPCISVLRIRICWIRKILVPVSGSAKLCDPRILIQGTKYKPKTAKKKKIYSKPPNLNCWKKRDYRNFLISKWFIQF